MLEIGRSEVRTFLKEKLVGGGVGGLSTCTGEEGEDGRGGRTGGVVAVAGWPLLTRGGSEMST